MNNTEEYFGLKELNSVVIRALSNMRIGNRYFLAGEPILYFEKIQIANLKENSSAVSARGGLGNFSQVVWDQLGDVTFQMVEGVMSKSTIGILTGAGLFDYEDNEKTIKVPKRESLTVMNGAVITQYAALSERIFVYTLDSNGFIADSVNNFVINDRTITLTGVADNTEILVDYYFNYNKSFSSYSIGDKTIDGYLSLEGKAYVKSENDGINRTFLFEMPKVKITSNLDIIMGEKASPTVSVFNIIGIPIKEGNHFVVCKMNLLEEDIDSDI